MPPSPILPLHLLVLASGPERHEALVSALRGAGHRVMSAADGVAAVEAIGAANLDAVVLDLRWPELEPARLCEVLAPTTGVEPGSLEDAERRHIALTLRHTGGNRRRAAQVLGISRSTLLHKVRKYGLDQP